MMDLDPKGLEAAAETMWSRRDFWGTSDLAEELAEAAIRAYEAHKASEGYRWVKFTTASPPPFQFDDEPCAQCGGSGYCEADPGGVCPRCNGGGREASAVPEVGTCTEDHVLHGIGPSAVPDDLPLSDPRHPESINSFLPSALPDEVSTLVSQLRWSLGRDMNTEDMRRRAADLLEQMAREIEELKEALENAVVRLRITQELAQQLADLKTPPNRNE